MFWIKEFDKDRVGEEVFKVNLFLEWGYKCKVGCYLIGK